MSARMLSGQVALVTGASRGIGRGDRARHSARRARKSSARRPPKPAQRRSARRWPRCRGPRHRARRHRRRRRSSAASTRSSKETAPCTILVNNAGITRDKLLMRMKDEDWHAVLDTNLTSVFRPARPSCAAMMKARTAASSTSPRWSASAATPARPTTPPPRPASSASPSRWRARSAAAASPSTCVAPGFIDTDMTARARRGAAAALLGADPARAGWARRRTSPQAVAFLASPRGRLHHRRDPARQRRHVHGLSLRSVDRRPGGIG